MPNDTDPLAGLVISQDTAVRTECRRIARLLLLQGIKRLGLWPAGADIPASPVALQLGAALVVFTGRTVAVVAANPPWPAASMPSSAAEQGTADSDVSTRWLDPSLAVLLPVHVGEAGSLASWLRLLLARRQDTFSFMLVDLTGFDLLGEHLDALDLIDAAMIIGRIGHTTERQLLRASDQLPAQKNLGVVLVG